ncbi:MAG: hypothetical protein ABR903_05330 [Thermodesulfovibrionales bacterium]
METIVNWLTHIELTASIFYKDAVVWFKDDEKLAEFLNRLSDDETWHYQVMKDAAKYLRKKDPELPFVTLTASRIRLKLLFKRARACCPIRNSQKKIWSTVLLRLNLPNAMIFFCMLSTP